MRPPEPTLAFEDDDDEGVENYGDSYGANYGAYRRPPNRPRGTHRRPPPPRTHHPVLVGLFIVLTLVVVAALLTWRWADNQISPGGRLGAPATVTISSGASVAQIGSTLAHAGVIHGGSLFRFYVKLRGDGPLLPGTYRLAKNESYSQAISALMAGPPVIEDRLTIPEGFTMAQIAAAVGKLPDVHLSAAKFLAAANGGEVRSQYEQAGTNHLEGLLFPATYQVRQGMTEVDVLEQMVGAFDNTAATLGLSQAASKLGLTPYQVVIVASIVEREAKLAGDRGDVASVLYNRLIQGKPLGADSTLIYALRLANPNLDLNTVDYNQPNPYNTRLNLGLPPTAISNPGLPSLTAAAEPPTTSYLYFVEINSDGQLGFASTDAGFTQLEAQCRQANLC